MHDKDADGNEFFKCDFCGLAWADDRPMVEGHQGSLICAPCLTVAYVSLVVHEEGMVHSGAKCSMCLEERKQPQWESPVRDARVCLRCLKQSATVLEKDKDYAWKRPG